MRAIVIANGADNDAGVVGQLLSSQGYEIQQLSRDDDREWQISPASDDVVLSLGSDWSVYWPEITRFVDREAHFLGHTHNLGIPILGICFGAQMLAHCLGGRVERAPQAEVGWFPVTWEPLKVKKWAENEHFGPLFSQNPWFQWHYDRFIAPEGADIWATSPAGVQTFSLQKSVGIQFHPEVTPAIVARWASGGGADELLRIGVHPAALIEQTEAHLDASSARAALLMEWFNAQVHKEP